MTLNSNKKQRLNDSNILSTSKKPFQLEEFDMTGIVFFTQLNDKNAQMIPSSKNYLNNIQLRILKQDRGANYSLFYFESVQNMFEVFDAFPSNLFYHSLSEITTLGGIMYAVIFESKNKLNTSFFPKLRFMTDILPSNTETNTSAVQTTGVSLKKVYFHLSDEDIFGLVQSWNDPQSLRKAAFSSADCNRLTKLVKKISEFKVTTDHLKDPVTSTKTKNTDCSDIVDTDFLVVSSNCESNKIVTSAIEFSTTGADMMYPRRKCSLIGKDILKQLGHIGNEYIQFYIDKSTNQLQQWSWDHIHSITTELLKENYLKYGTSSEINEFNNPNSLSEVIFTDFEIDQEYIPFIIG